MDAFNYGWTEHFWFLFIMLALSFLLAWFLRWLFWERGYIKIIEDLKRERDSLRSKNTDLEKELASARYRIDELEKKSSDLRIAVNRCEADRASLQAKINQIGEPSIVTGGGTDLKDTSLQLTMLGGINEDALRIYEANGIGSVNDLNRASEEDLARMFEGSKYNYYFAKNQSDLIVGDKLDDFKVYKLGNYDLAFRNDNLQIIEGIGPKIEGLLKDAGIKNWYQLSVKSRDELKAILNEKGGKRYQMHDPKTWPEQARLANEGKWEELQKYQKFLDTGRDNTGSGNSPAKIDKLVTKILGIKADPDDLKVVEGIGPKIEGLLKADGIKNWSELAKASADRLQGILDRAGDRYKLAVPNTWPRQAELAAAGKWAELKEYQDYLQGGKDLAKG